MVVKGAVDVLLTRMDQIQIGSEVRPMTEQDRKNIEEQNQAFSRQGLRVLAFAYKTVSDELELTLEDEYNLTFIGLIAMMDPPREESKAAVAECKKAGIRPIMITGDHKVTAAAIAKRIGILEDESEACEGAEIDKLSDEELKDFVEGISVYARVSPEHKIRIVRAWQDKGNIVAMTGDGVNDAPALKMAHVGIAMGGVGSDIAVDAADIALVDDEIRQLPHLLALSRRMMRTIKLNLTFDELDNIVTQGKELGVYFYMMTGGEPLVRKADIIRLCEKHNDCAFHCYTNGTLVDEKLCEDMKRVGNLSLSISLEGFEDANDFRRGEGVYNKVLHAMDLLHENGLIFGNSVCYTSKNMDAVTSDEFFDL